MEVNFFQLDVYYFSNLYVTSSLISISLDIYNSLDPEATESGTRPIFLSGFKLYTLYSILSQLCSLYYFNSRARGHFSCLGWNLLRRKPFSEAAALSQTWFVLYSTRRSLLLFPPVLSQCTCREGEGFIHQVAPEMAAREQKKLDLYPPHSEWSGSLWLSKYQSLDGSYIELYHP